MYSYIPSVGVECIGACGTSTHSSSESGCLLLASSVECHYGNAAIENASLNVSILSSIAVALIMLLYTLKELYMHSRSMPGKNMYSIIMQR